MQWLFLACSDYLSLLPFKDTNSLMWKADHLCQKGKGVVESSRDMSTPKHVSAPQSHIEIIKRLFSLPSNFYAILLLEIMFGYEIISLIVSTKLAS